MRPVYQEAHYMSALLSINPRTIVGAFSVSQTGTKRDSHFKVPSLLQRQVDQGTKNVV